MLTETVIENYRGFSQLEMGSLKRVNLLVGRNNCGKTSALEAIALLASCGDPKTVWSILHRRGETNEDPEHGDEVQVVHLFRDRNSRRSIALSGLDHLSCEMALEFTIAEPSEDEIDDLGLVQRRQHRIGTNYFNTEFHHQAVGSRTHSSRLSPDGGLTMGRFARGRIDRENKSPLIRFISSSALSIEEVITLYNEIVLTDEENLVIEALQTIEPTIERIAPIASSRGGMVVKCSDQPERLPIGSMGDGLWRMLGLSLALAGTAGGTLFIDEIDTGLHYTVLERMWLLITKAAARLDVQVFATSHNRDCYEALANVVLHNCDVTGDVSIHRIEKGRSKSVPFTGEEMVIAAERGIEVR